MIDLDANVGRYCIALDFRGLSSPFVRAVLPDGITPGEAVERINRDLPALFSRHMGNELHWSLNGPPEVAALSSSGVIEPKERREAKRRKSESLLAADFVEADRARDAKMAAHPSNGQVGYWLVSGIRHEAVVKASNAPEAIEKAHAAGNVDRTWESPVASFIGAEMPEVFGL
jgi:hypothetical protein